MPPKVEQERYLRELVISPMINYVSDICPNSDGGCQIDELSSCHLYIRLRIVHWTVQSSKKRSYREPFDVFSYNPFQSLELKFLVWVSMTKIQLVVASSRRGESMVL
jgi:hypothetical protein